jgi:two-component system, NarL family, sensor histidine kinase UhpB
VDNNHVVQIYLLRIVALIAFSTLAMWALPARSTVVVIDQAQVFEPANPNASAQPPGADATWKTQALPDAWKTSREHYGGTLWYRIQLDASDLLNTPAVPALYIERVCSTMAVYLNGVMVGSGGHLELPYSRNCFTPQLFSLPQTLLKPGLNTVYLQVVGYPLRQVSAAQRSSGLSVIRLGTLQELQPVFEQARWYNIALPKVITVVLLVFSVFIGAIWLVRRQDSYYGYFVVWIAWWALNTSRLYIIDPPLAGPWVETLMPAAGPICLLGIVLFLMRYLGTSVRWVNRLVWWQVLVIPVIMLLAGWDRIYSTTRIVYLWLLLQLFVASAWFLWAAWHRARRDFWLFSFMLLAMLGVAAVEMGAAFFNLNMVRHIGHLGSSIILLPMCLRLIWVFSDSLRHTEQLNTQLEGRIAQKSAEIERTYAALAQASAREAAQNERKRIAADLHDDLGAKLLTMVHAGAQSSQRTADMARQALDDMRLSVRGMTAEPSLARNVLADWRAEAMQRLDGARIEGQWNANEPAADLVLPARLQVQLTRVLRETVSNVIRHSQAQRCVITVHIEADHLSLAIADDGRGIPLAHNTQGHGLPNIERRARNLGGQHHFGTSSMGGALVSLTVLLSGDSQPAALS